jgi:major vault protein
LLKWRTDQFFWSEGLFNKLVKRNEQQEEVMVERSTERELKLMPNEYAFILDDNGGVMQAVAGPCVITLNQNEVPVLFEPRDNRYQRCERVADAIRHWPEAPEGSYIKLANPTTDPNRAHPIISKKSEMTTLDMGRVVNVRGPCTFPLWPGQSAQVIAGHRLRSNQYLVVRVYNPEEATANWGTDGIMQTTNGGGTTEVAGQRTFTDGELIIIRGSEVKFFIPPTGVEVVPTSGAQFVRDAVSLERLEYCVLMDENGERRFETGPKVVFPEPTEEFVTAGGRIKHRAIELDDTWGIFIKVTEDHEEADGTLRRQGDQLFITGRDQRVYIPRKEHSIVSRGDGEYIHYGVAIPEGSARYVLDKQSGEVRTVCGPCILLPDPRKEIIVRRMLSDDQCALMFPGNHEALRLNQQLRQMASNGVLESSVKPHSFLVNDKYEGAVVIKVWPNYAVKVVDSKGKARVIRGPQTVILGYDEDLQAMVLSTGKPKTTEKVLRTVYLQGINNQVGDIVDVQTKDLVDMQFKLSLRINFEGDEQKWFDMDNYVKFICDRVRSMLRNMAKQFGIEELNARYVELVRDCILGKDKLDNGERRGRTFQENGVRITDVEVLGVKIGDERIAHMITDAQHTAVAGAIKLADAERQLVSTRRLQRIGQEEAALRHETEVQRVQLEQAQLTCATELVLARIAAGKQEGACRHDVNLQNADNDKVLQGLVIERQRECSEFERLQRQADEDQRLAISRADLEQRLLAIQTEAEAVVKQAGAITPQLVAAIEQVGHAEILKSLGENLSVVAVIQQLLGTGEEGVTGLAKKIFAGTAVAGAVDRLDPQHRTTTTR